MRWLESTIAAFSPRTALRRAQARQALRFVEGMGRNPLDFDRNTGKVSDALPPRTASHRRLTALIKTNPHARKALNALLNNLIGYGITGTPKKGTPAKVLKEWKWWIKHSDWLGRLDFYGQQEQSVATMLGYGDCFIIRRIEKSNGHVPLKIELLPWTMLAKWKGEEGIEYDDRGRPARYHFRRNRSANDNDVVTFEAADVIHLFRADDPDQRRGQSIFEPVIKRLEDLDGYFEAEVLRKQIEACFAGFIQPDLDAPDADLGKRDGDTSVGGFDTETLEPGMLLRLNPGETVQFGTPRVTSAIAEFTRVTLLTTTAGVGIPYEHGSGDLSNVNYSSYKAGSLEFQRFCGRLQWLLIIPVMLERIWEWFLDDGYKTGIFARDDYSINWMPAEFESLDLKKDTDGLVAQMKAGLTSRRKLVAAKGEDIDELTAEIADDLESQGDLVFAGDPVPAPAQSQGGANAGPDALAA